MSDQVRFLHKCGIRIHHGTLLGAVSCRVSRRFSIPDRLRSSPSPFLFAACENTKTKFSMLIAFCASALPVPNYHGFRPEDLGPLLNIFLAQATRKKRIACNEPSKERKLATLCTETK